MNATTPAAKRLGFVALGVSDVAAASEFFRTVGRLTVSSRRPTEAFLTGGTEHHWFHLYESESPGEFRLAYEVTDPSVLDVVGGRLAERGLKYSRAEETEYGVFDSLRFVDPDGVEIELYSQMMELPSRPVQPTVRIKKLLHAVWSTTSTLDGYEFYSSVLGFRASDWIERRVVFMRCADGYHHSAGLIGAGEGAAGRLHHFCILVESLDDVMRARANAMARGVEVRQDVLRHAASGSIGIYLGDPHSGASMEFCTGPLRVDDESSYRARVMPGGPVTSDLWQEGANQEES